METTSTEDLNENRILIVDDDDIYLFSASYSINKFYPGFEIVTSRNGEDGLERINQLEISALFLDLDMPLMSGWEVIDALKSKFTTPPFPIVITSATDDQKEIDQLKADSFIEAFIGKPMTPEKLGELNLVL